MSTQRDAWRNWTNGGEVLLRDDTSDGRIAPRMFIATHRCGGLVASSWDDDGHEEENQQNCRDWRVKGYQVAKISVKESAPMMPWCNCIRQDPQGGAT